MVNAETAPALPWGISTAQGTAGRPAESQADRDQADREGALPVIVPQPGSAIEVRWQIEEEGHTERMWWKGIVGAAAPELSSTPQAATLRYQAYRSFEEETANVRFLPEGRLCHLDNSEERLRWRAEGDDGDESEEDSDDGMVMDAGDLDQEAEVLERELGVSAEQVMEQQLRSYPVDQQRHLASGYRNFVDHFKEQLGQLAAAQGGSYTVTESDVHGIFQQLKR